MFEKFISLQNTGILNSEIKTESAVTLDDFLSRVKPTAQSKVSTLLLGHAGHELGKHSLFAFNPCLLISAKNSVVKSKSNQNTYSYRSDNPFTDVQNIISAFDRESLPQDIPFHSGLTGYFAYELKNCIESLPQTASDDLELPDLWLMIPADIIVHNAETNILTSIHHTFSGLEPIDSANQLQSDGEFSNEHARLHKRTSRIQHINNVNQIKEHIKQGDIYQANLTQRFEIPLREDSFNLFCKIYKKNPAPFYAYLQCGDHQILCTSMERFIKVSGHQIESRPIKGTIPRGSNVAEDSFNADKLLSSEKNSAELAMIVDLMRNDLSKICQQGSVKVDKHKLLESFDNVHHLVSIVSGILKDKVQLQDIFSALFPGGSITGCPKIRAMEIIDNYEPVARHVYTGSIGYIDFSGSIDLNIAIRTGIVKNNRLHFYAGGGIVYDSDPEEEYEETIHKLRTFFEMI